MAVLLVSVRERPTNAPVPYVLVTLDGYSDATGPDGTARFEVPPGTYTLRVRSPVHRPVTRAIRIPGEGTFRVEIHLVRAHF